MPQGLPNSASLPAIIESRVQQVHTTSLDLSFNELLDMHEGGELNISPGYQRLFQWSEGARSRFIESLLLEMPVPPIFVLEEEDGTYLLIDGLQRLSSYLHLRGRLSAPHLDPPVEPGEYLKLSDCDIVGELNGRTWDDLDTALQIRLKRSFVRVEVVRKGSDPRFRYYMFKRLNTGGQILSDQQIRNCTIRLLDNTFNDFIQELSRNEDFRGCTSILSSDRLHRAYDEELVLRFFALRNYRDNFVHDVNDFLTEYMERVSEPHDEARQRPFDYEAERDAFERTFAILNRTLSDYSFAYRHPGRDQLVRGFSVLQYEALTIGLQPFIHNISIEEPDDLSVVEDALMAVKNDDVFREIITGGGKNSPGPLNDRISFVEERLREALA